MKKNFAMFGVGGFVAPRHLKAIADTGNVLVGASDPKDSVGIMDRYFPDADFFTEVERFDRFLEKRRRGPEEERVHYVSVCTPNYLHDAHIRMGLRIGADVICEKPLVVSPWNLDQLAAIEQETGRRLYTVLQLRLLPALAEMRDRLRERAKAGPLDVVLTYMTARGHWYHVSWKGTAEKSGGLAMNIGIHLFDLMIWLFGDLKRSDVHLADPDRMSGVLELEHARVRWFLSVNRDDLPAATVAAGKTAYRSIEASGETIEFSEGFTDLHTRVYERVLRGEGYGIDVARPSVELAYGIRTAKVDRSRGELHPLLQR